MKQGITALLSIMILLIFSNANTQNVEFTEVNKAEIKTAVKNKLHMISFEGSSGELILDKGDGVEIKKHVQLDKNEFWRAMVLKDKLYFYKSTFKKDVLTYTVASYNLESYKLETARTVLTVASKSDPTWYTERILISENENYFAISVSPGQLMQYTTSERFISKSKVIVVIDKDLNVLYQTELPFKYDDNDFNYDVANVLSDDGTWYWFGILYSGKGDEKKGEYGFIETTPDGKSSGFQKIGFEKSYISSVDSYIVGDKLIQFGLWSKSSYDETMSGTFYLEMDTQTGRIVNQQSTEFTTAEIMLFLNSSREGKNEKSGIVPGMQRVWNATESEGVEYGNYAAIYRRFDETSIEGYDKTAGGILISRFGPNSSDMINTIILLNQHTPGQENLFNMEAAILKDKIVVVFNDHQANEHITTSGEPKLYDPFPLKINTTATFAVVINSEGKAKRTSLASLASDDMIFFDIKEVISDNSLIIRMEKDPKTMVNNFTLPDYDALKSYILKVVD